MMIILIGPMKVGKSTVARLLAERLGLQRHALDKNRWAYYAEIGFDEAHARHLADSDSVEAALKYCKPFEAHAVERHLAESRDCVVDFGAGYSVQEDPVLYERVKRALAPHPYVVLLLPCPDVEEAIACLNERVSEELRALNEHYIKHPANRALATAVVYTRGKTPEETCEDVVRILGIDPK
jgi:broad-specificity NMP kinase